jgi:hypothetical protein
MTTWACAEQIATLHASIAAETQAERMTPSPFPIPRSPEHG